MNNQPQSLYIHIPFCEAICDYCDFPKLQYFRIFAEKYLQKLKEEIESYKISHTLKTIYIGGGTPTCLEDDLFAELLKIVEPYAKNISEYTMEANPESLTIEKLKLMKQFGVNRLSIGVESTNDRILKAINRHHTFQDVKTAIKNAKMIGFNNINVDLILGLPNATKEQLKKDLDNLLSLPITHISCYSLSVHPHTNFYIKGIKEQNSDIERQLYDYVYERLKEANFIHYEVSNWAKENYESQHNFTYWKDEPYYGVGLGAAGYINGIRYTNTLSINEYLKGITVKEKEMITINDDKEYFLMLNLRTNRGVILKEYKEKFHEDFYKENKKIIQQYIADGLMTFNEKEERIYLTYPGMMILDTILLEFMNGNSFNR